MEVAMGIIELMELREAVRSAISDVSGMHVSLWNADDVISRLRASGVEISMATAPRPGVGEGE
jgi:hypothetical protein